VLKDNFKPVIHSKAKKQTFSKIKKIENFDLKDENLNIEIKEKLKKAAETENLPIKSKEIKNNLISLWKPKDIEFIQQNTKSLISLKTKIDQKIIKVEETEEEINKNAEEESLQKLKENYINETKNVVYNVSMNKNLTTVDFKHKLLKKKKNLVSVSSKIERIQNAKKHYSDAKNKVVTFEEDNWQEVVQNFNTKDKTKFMENFTKFQKINSIQKFGELIDDEDGKD
jgi:hypothetical protein